MGFYKHLWLFIIYERKWRRIAKITVASTTTSAIKVNITSIDSSCGSGVRKIFWYIDGDNDGATDLASDATSSGYHTFSGLDEDTSYLLKAIIMSGTVAVKTLTATVSTDASVSAASYTISNIAANSVQLSIRTSPIYDYYRIYWRKSSVTDADFVDLYRSADFYHTISGLRPNTQYVVNVQAGGPTGTYLGAKTFTTESSPRPDDFEWTYSKVSNGEFNLRASEWNAFTARINEFLVYRGLSVSFFTTAIAGHVFTADMYNEARIAIQRIDGYGSYIPVVSTGDIILAGGHLNLIVSELNSIP